jgi:DnaJ-class molecular chaperone
MAKPSPKSTGSQPVSQQGHMHPGDQAPEGTPGTGENVCPRCGGKGKLDSGDTCPECEGTGHVTTGIGGA